MATESLQFCGQTDISAHLSISGTHTMTATPFSPTGPAAIYRPLNWKDTRGHSASNSTQHPSYCSWNHPARRRPGYKQLKKLSHKRLF